MNACLSLSYTLLEEECMGNIFFPPVINTPGYNIYFWPLERNMYWYQSGMHWMPKKQQKIQTLSHNSQSD